LADSKGKAIHVYDGEEGGLLFSVHPGGKRGNPEKFDRCVRKVKSKSRGRVNAYAVCTAGGTRGNPIDYQK